MASTQLELLGENIDSIFFIFAAAIFLIEVIELGLKAISAGPKSQKCWRVHPHRFRIV